MKTKRILSVILTLTMILSLCCLTAGAEGEEATVIGYDASKVVKINTEGWTDFKDYNKDDVKTQYVISDWEGFQNLCTVSKGSGAVNSWGVGMTIVLTADIDGAGASCIGICSNKNCFCGTFDGQGHTISNYKTEKAASYTGFIGRLGNNTATGIVRNVVLKNITFTSTSNQAAVLVGAATGDGTIENCSIMDSVASSTGTAIALVVAQIDSKVKNTLTIKNVTTSGNVTSTNTRASAVVGFHSSGAVVIENCVNYANVTTTSSSASIFLGSAAAKTATNATDVLTIKNCVNYGSVTAPKLCGVFMGISANTPIVTIENCTNYGKVSSASYHTSYPMLIGESIGSEYNPITKLTVTNCTSGNSVLTKNAYQVSTDGASIRFLSTFKCSNLEEYSEIGFDFVVVKDSKSYEMAKADHYVYTSVLAGTETVTPDEGCYFTGEVLTGITGITAVVYVTPYVKTTAGITIYGMTSKVTLTDGVPA